MGSSIVDFASLQTAAANWMTRAGNADLVANTPDFIALTEEIVNFGHDDPEMAIPPLRVAQMEVALTSLTILSGSNIQALPSDYLQLRRIFENTSGTVTAGINKLTYVTPNQMDATMSRFPNGPPNAFFTILGQNVVAAAPMSTSDTISFSYYQKIPPLSSSNTVNWLVQTRPLAYLWGTLFGASLFVGDDEGVMKWGRLFAGALRSFGKQDLKGRYSGDVLQMKSDTGNP